jgi:hypothetical protein
VLLSFIIFLSKEIEDPEMDDQMLKGANRISRKRSSRDRFNAVGLLANPYDPLFD